MTHPHITPCETCGKPVDYPGARKCDRCWEVEKRLEGYLQSPKALEVVRQFLPPLDDWTNGKPGWDHEAVLHQYGVKVVWADTVIDEQGNEKPAPDYIGWSLSWKHGCIHIGRTSEVIARKAAALFVSLWLRGVSASFCDKLMDGYIEHLERQEATSLAFLAEIDCSMEEGYFRLTRKGLFDREPFTFDMEARLLDALDPRLDEEIVVTFTKRKKA